MASRALWGNASPANPEAALNSEPTIFDARGGVRALSSDAFASGARIDVVD
jgi:hypothetical protein